MSKKNVFVSDFETTAKEEDCRVWAYAIANVYETDKLFYGNSIESFIEQIKQLPNNSTIFFHNLKFDGQFLMNKFLHMGFKWAKNKNQTNLENYFQFVINRTGQWYAGSVKFSNGVKIKFIDSLKKLPFKVKEIAISFDLDMLKGDLDHDIIRPKNHVLTPEEKEYLDNDIKIICEAIALQYEQGMTGNTIASDSLKDLKATLGKSKFENLFPILSNDLYYNLKLAYRGGATMVSDKFKEKEVGEGLVFDITSQYPWAMKYKPMPVGLPMYFKGKYKEKFKNKFPLYIQHIRCEFEIKKDHIPTIQIKNDKRFKATEFLKDSQDEIVDLYMTNIDLELFFEHYEVYNYEFIDGYMFQSITGIFAPYIDKHLYVKENSKGGKRTLAKLKLNSPYGKFGADPDVTGKIGYLDENGKNAFRSKDRIVYFDENGKQKTEVLDELKEYGQTVYIPVAIFVTSYGRELTIRTAQKVYDRFCYCDTDSIHITGTDIPEEIKDLVHPKKLGYWKHESTFKRAKFIRAKTYIEDEYVLYKKDENGNIMLDRLGEPIFKEGTPDKNNGTHLNVKCAGMPDNVKQLVNFDNFKIGTTFIGKDDKGKPIEKLVPKQCVGGVILEGQPFTIKKGGVYGF